MARQKPEIEIFRAGKHVAADGRTFEFSVGDLEQIAQTYDPQNYRAPIIISHDTQGLGDKALSASEFAHGWVDRLRVVGNSLRARLGRVAPEFVQWVREGRILDRSASFYLPTSPQNPTPGRLALRHIAALGTTPPAVKAMEPLSLSEASQGVVEFGDCACGENSMMYDESCLPKKVFQGVRDYVLASSGSEAADRAISHRDIKRLAMHDQQTQARIADLELQVGAMEAQMAELIGEFEPAHQIDSEMDLVAGMAMNYSEESNVDFSEMLDKVRDLKKERDAAIAKQKHTEAVSFCEAVGVLNPDEAFTVSFSDGSNDKFSTAEFMASLDEEQLGVFKQIVRRLAGQSHLGPMFQEFSAEANDDMDRRNPVTDAYAKAASTYARAWQSQ
jgi:hypothetical protein